MYTVYTYCSHTVYDTVCIHSIIEYILDNYMFGTEVWQLPSLEDNGST